MSEIAHAKRFSEWNTRQESNLRALGSRPNGDTGNPRLVYWIRRQESDLRGLRSERSWDASNPHLNKLAGRQGIEPCCSVLETKPLPEDNPKLAESGPLEGHALSDTQRFPAVSSPWLVHSPGLAEGGSHDDHTVAGTGCFRGSGGAPATSPSIIGGCGRSRTCTAVTPSRGSNPISTPMRASEVGGRQ